MMNSERESGSQLEDELSKLLDALTSEQRVDDLTEAETQNDEASQVRFVLGE